MYKTLGEELKVINELLLNTLQKTKEEVNTSFFNWGTRKKPMSHFNTFTETIWDTFS